MKISINATIEQTKTWWHRALVVQLVEQASFKRWCARSTRAKGTTLCTVAQLVERSSVKRGCAGSSPACAAISGSSSTVERVLWKHEAVGAAPAFPTKSARVTQSGKSACLKSRMSLVRFRPRAVLTS